MNYLVLQNMECSQVKKKFILLEGELFLSKNIPYTLETLAVEFNREESEVEADIKIFMNLEMVELTQYKVYKVKNFAKHQNIKKREKVQKQDNLEEIINNEQEVKNNKAENGIIENSIIKDIKLLI